MLDLTPSDARVVLLRLARDTLIAAAAGSPDPVCRVDGALAERASAFVTLRSRQRLRGCVGDTSYAQPLGRVVQRMTRMAALSDPRFEPVASPEVAEIAIEISRLSPLRSAEAGDVVPGEHGIVVSLESHRGLLLPQVAVEFGCDARGFLELACRKAGLPRAASDDPRLRIEVFEAEVFGE